MALDTTTILQPSAIESANDNAVRIVQKRINALHKKHKRILQLEGSLSQGKHLNEEEQEALRSKHTVLVQTDLLEKLLEEFSANACTVDAAVKDADDDAPAGSLNEQRRGVAQDLSKPASLLPMPVKNQERYLCISDGFIIYCLDLEKGRADQPNGNCSDIPHLPKTSSIKLPEKGFPILGGLFKLGSDAYIIGGRKFEASGKDPHHWFMSIFSSFAEVSGLNGTSRVAYRLSLADGGLCLTECDDIKPLNDPIAWPLVEKIGDEIHVVESFPIDSFTFSETGMANHEALNCNNISRSWTEIGHEYGVRIFAHLVVGDWMYAKAECRHTSTLIFDSKTHKWENVEESIGHLCDFTEGPFSINHVVSILQYGRGRCVGGFLHGEFGNSLYIVFAVIVDPVSLSVHAVAYLVAMTGQVVCFQRLPRFFGGVFEPTSVIESAVINVDDGGGTMCSIVHGTSSEEAASECLFVYTFTVEHVPGDGSWVRNTWKRRIDEQWAIEREFVKVAVKDRYVYRMDAPAGRRFAPMQACFL